MRSPRLKSILLRVKNRWEGSESLACPQPPLLWEMPSSTPREYASDGSPSPQKGFWQLSRERKLNYVPYWYWCNLDRKGQHQFLDVALFSSKSFPPFIPRKIGVEDRGRRYGS